MDPRLPDAIALFNSLEFYACHDCLESIWNDAPISDRPFYQGLLQVAVGLYHWQNANYRGAMLLIGAGISNLRHFQPKYFQIDVRSLMQSCHTIYQHLPQQQPPRSPFDFPQISVLLSHEL
jgi:Uncharacterized conserved protein